MSRDRAIKQLSLLASRPQGVWTHLQEGAQRLREARLQPSSWRTHASALKWWFDFCASLRLHPVQALRSHDALGCFVAFLFNANRLPLGVMAAVSAWATTIWPDWRSSFYKKDTPLMAAVVAADTSLRRARKEAGVHSLQAAPVRLWWMRALSCKHWTPSVSQHFQDLVIVAVGVLALLRAGSLVNIQLRHISEQALEVGPTKTNTQGKEHRVNWPLPACSPISAASLVASWACLAHGYCLKSIPHAHGAREQADAQGSPEDPLFFNTKANGERVPLNESQIGDAVRRYVKAVQESPAAASIMDLPTEEQGIRGHSLRHGGATALIEAGVPAEVVIAKGLWSAATSLSAYVHRESRTWSPQKLDTETILLRKGDAEADAVAQLPSFSQLEHEVAGVPGVSVHLPAAATQPSQVSSAPADTRRRKRRRVRISSNNNPTGVISVTPVTASFGCAATVVGPHNQHQHQHTHQAVGKNTQQQQQQQQEELGRRE